MNNNILNSLISGNLEIGDVLEVNFLDPLINDQQFYKVVYIHRNVQEIVEIICDFRGVERVYQLIDNNWCCISYPNKNRVTIKIYKQLDIDVYRCDQIDKIIL